MSLGRCRKSDLTNRPVEAFSGRGERMLEPGRSADVTAHVSCCSERAAVVFLRLEDDDVHLGQEQQHQRYRSRRTDCETLNDRRALHNKQLNECMDVYQCCSQ